MTHSLLDKVRDLFENVVTLQDVVKITLNPQLDDSIHRKKIRQLIMGVKNLLVDITDAKETLDDYTIELKK